TVELDDRRGVDVGELLVERDNAGPIRVLGRPRSGVAGGDRSLQRIGAGRVAELLGAAERREPAPDEKLIPARAVLIEQQDGRAIRTGTRPQARRLDLHQGDETV